MINKIFKNKNLKSAFGFTLAEVLITLTIIGVIAAMTIPTLLQNHQKHQTVTKLKAAYSIFSQALSMAAAEHGDIKNWDEDLARIDVADRTQYFFDNYLKPYMKIEKSCHPTNSECWTDTISLSGTSGYVNNSSIGNGSSSCYRMSFILKNGMTAYIWASADPKSAHIYVNINGLKNKAIYGKDIFSFKLGFNSSELPILGFSLSGAELTTDEVINDSSNGCSKTVQSKSSGRYCGELIRRSGWQITDDYPW